MGRPSEVDEWMPAFMKVLEAGATSISETAWAVQVSRSTVYRQAKRDKVFAARLDTLVRRGTTRGR